MEQKSKQTAGAVPKRPERKPVARRSARGAPGGTTTPTALTIPVRPLRGRRSPKSRKTEEGTALMEATWSPEKDPECGEDTRNPDMPQREERSPGGGEGSWHTASPAGAPGPSRRDERTHEAIHSPLKAPKTQEDTIGEEASSAEEPVHGAVSHPVSVTITRSEMVGDEGGFTSCSATGHMARRVSLVEEIETRSRSSGRMPTETSSAERASGSASPGIRGAPPSTSDRDASVRFSIGGGINDAPAQATRAMLEAKEALESRSAGNIKREIREKVVESISLLHSLVLRLADSRARAIVEAERVKTQRYKDLDTQEARHSRALESTIKTVETATARIEKVDSTTESLRGIVLHDVMSTVDGLKAQIADMAREIKEMPQRLKAQPSEVGCTSDKSIAEIKQEINGIRAEIGSLRNACSSRPDEVAKALIPYLSELVQARQGEAGSGIADASRGEGEVPALLRGIQETLNGMKEADLACPEGVGGNGALEHTVREIGHRVATLTETTTAMGEMIVPLRTNVEELKKEIRTTAELMTETSGPTRAAIEQLRGELREKTLPVKGDGEPGATTSSAVTRTPSGERKRRNRAQGEPIARPRFGLRLESGVPGKTSQELIDQVKSEVDVAALGIAVNNVRKTKGQCVVVTCDSADDREALSRAIKGTKTNITATPLQNKRPLIRLVGVANDLNDAQIPVALVNQNKKLIPGVDSGDLKVIRRTRGRASSLFNVILEVAPKVWASLRDQKVHLGYQIVPVLDQTPMLQCYNCMGFGHTARECRNVTTCGYCSGDHETRSCHNRNGNPTCCHCSQEGKVSHHPAYSADCPAWQKWDRIARISVSYC